MARLKVSPVILVVLFTVNIAAGDDIEVSTIYGKIRGIVQKSRDNRDYYSFRGVPYAQPPIGQLRFEPPVEPKPWDDVLDTTEDGFICPQAWKGDPTEISEDCLILNVYTNDLNAKKPVMVYIHGGSLNSNSAHSKYSVGPQYLMDHDVVLVSINYRLGIFGFIATDSKEAPGNLGFKDQVMALRWVQKNIENFGGDPNLVTLFGQSAGGISVTLHMVSPMSKNLFHRAISLSGAATTRIPALNQNQTKLVAAELNCPSESPVEMITCLKDVPYQKIIEASNVLNEFGINPIRKWNYVVEEDFGQERFIVTDPNVLMKTGEFHRMPFMIGVTSTEFAVYGDDIIKNETLLKQFNEKFEEVAPICFLYERGTKKSQEVSEILKREYFNNEEVTKLKFDELGQLFSDGILRSGLKRLVDRARNYQSIYVYTNSFVGRYGRLYYPDDKPYGLVHADDLQYIFVSDSPAPMFTHDDPENVMVEKLTGILTNFAANGVPGTNTEDSWIPTDSTNVNWYELSGSSTKQTFLDYLDLWDKLFPEQ